MARINFNEIDNFNKTSTSHWFSLKDDGDSALIQFPFNSLQDIEYQNVHNCKAVSQTGNTYEAMVACLRSRFDDPLDTCPLCSSGDVAKVPYLIPVIDYTTGEAKIWKRNKSFMDELNYNIQNTPNFRNTVFNRPAFSILNPELIYTVPKYHLSAGVCDMFVHIIERYFTNTKNV